MSKTARVFLGEATTEAIDAAVGGHFSTAGGWKSPADGRRPDTASDGGRQLHTLVAAEAAAAGLCAAFHP